MIVEYRGTIMDMAIEQMRIFTIHIERFKKKKLYNPVWQGLCSLDDWIIHQPPQPPKGLKVNR
jgi:hypothetical protein